MNKLLLCFAAVVLLLASNTSFSQVPNGTANLGILESFEAYTGAGGVSNGAGATLIGDVGTNVGIISGFAAGPLFTGNTHVANASTAQARFDLFRLYIHLNDKFVDFPATHAPAFGSAAGEIIKPGVYSIPAAGSLGGALTLDGGGDPNAFFIIKWGGALTAGAGATVNLTGGTQSCNVFFIADGAISIAANANLKGTLFAKVGAVGIGAGTVLEGRMLSMEGAITTGVGAIVSPPPGTCTIPIFCESGCSPAPSVDVLGVLSNYALFTILGAVSNTSTSGINGKIGTDSGASSGYESSILIGSFETANAATAQAKLDIDNAYIALMALPNTVTNHAAAFGIGETINAGVYFVNGAGSLGGTITLDAQNNPNSIFVFKFAGAFNVAALSKIILANGARRCNVFWIGGAGMATGAVSIGAAADLKGTFLSHGGACTSGAGMFLSGRLLSTGGAVTTDAGIVYNSPECVTSVTLKTTAKTDNLSVAAGATTLSVIANDISKGVQAVIGNAPGQVTLSFTNNGPLTMNTDGTITVAASASPGDYTITYTIREFSNSALFSTVTSTVKVILDKDTTAPSAPTITTPITVNANATLSVSGTAEAGSTVTVTFPDGTTGTATATVDGNYGPVTSLTPQSSGTITAKATDAAGNVSPDATTSYTETTSVGGTISGDQTICKDSAPGDLTVTGNTASVVKWQKSSDSIFTSPTDIAITTTTLLGVTIGNISQTTYFRAVVQDGSSPEQYSPVVTITIPSTTWNGTAWSNGAPVITTTAFITGNYSVTANIKACTLTVSNGAIVAIPSGSNVTLYGKLTVNAGSSFTLSSNSSLIQQTDAVNIGDITVQRFSAPMYRLDYTLWSSPVAGNQKLLDFSPLTNNTRFYTYNTATNQYNAVAPGTTVFDPAKSYLIRSPNDWIPYNASLSPAPVSFSGSFKGVPRNGNINFALSNEGTGFNAIGNPFPSAIQLNTFINANSNTIEGTLWFWRKYNNTNNLTSYSTCTLAGCVGTNNAINTNSNLISVGQGFIVKAKAGQTNVSFTNAMRSKTNVDQFFKTANEPVDRYWLKMTNTTNSNFGQNLIAHTNAATVGYDSGLDGLYFNESEIAFYTKAGANEVVINARPSFDVTDVIPMYFKSNVAATYTFSLNQKEGVFSGTQAIYLKDNLNNTVHNLTLGSYTFSTAAGLFTDRFNIIYQNLLGTIDPTVNSNQIIIYNKNQTTFINSGEIKMDSIKIFDVQGRFLFSKTGINDSKINLNLSFNNQVLLYHITSQDGGTVIKKVIN